MIHIILIILALDWAAIHDILKGEPDTFGEYLFLFLSACFFIIFYLMRRKIYIIKVNIIV